ncbi:hypothetical protein Tco_0854144 [Tanacetum coccineum]
MFRNDAMVAKEDMRKQYAECKDSSSERRAAIEKFLAIKPRKITRLRKRYGRLTLIFATLEDLDFGLLGDVISEDDCGDDGEDENVFIIGERCNLGWMNIVKITSPRDV